MEFNKDAMKAIVSVDPDIENVEKRNAAVAKILAHRSPDQIAETAGKSTEEQLNSFAPHYNSVILSTGSAVATTQTGRTTVATPDLSIEQEKAGTKAVEAMFSEGRKSIVANTETKQLYFSKPSLKTIFGETAPKGVMKIDAAKKAADFQNLVPGEENKANYEAFWAAVEAAEAVPAHITDNVKVAGVEVSTMIDGKQEAKTMNVDKGLKGFLMGTLFGALPGSKAVPVPIEVNVKTIKTDKVANRKSTSKAGSLFTVRFLGLANYVKSGVKLAYIESATSKGNELLKVKSELSYKVYGKSTDSQGQRKTVTRRAQIEVPFSGYVKDKKFEGNKDFMKADRTSLTLADATDPARLADKILAVAKAASSPVGGSAAKRELDEYGFASALSAVLSADAQKPGIDVE